jgi:hypothetical protein
MSSLDIAPHPEGAPAFGRDRCRIRRRFRVSSRRAGSCTFWRLGFRQFSFHRIARVPRRTVPDTWTRPPVSCHALFPLTFRRQVRHRTQGHPSNPSRLRRGYNEAPRGAHRICRKWCVHGGEQQPSCPVDQLTGEMLRISISRTPICATSSAFRLMIDRMVSAATDGSWASHSIVTTASSSMSHRVVGGVR